MTENAKNPNSFLRLIRRAERGKLKVYLGHAPGVGKTYQMLLEGHRLKEDHIDVVVGLVETHDRKDTAELISGLEVIPRMRVDYRGITLEEMDVDAIMTRKPQVALVDELAHTNPPGHRNPKRYMDVQDMLAAGIHVITTMNVQHLESLYNTVESLAHIKVMERLPDAVLKEADEIVNVDVSPEDLLKRLRAGKIYSLDRVETAAQNYFQVPNLEQLRELTLRETASQIDFRRRGQLEEGEQIVPDQIVVCLSSSGLNNAHLLRFASRLAGQMNRKWYAIYVQTPDEEPTAIDAASQRSLSDTLTLANQLGAMVFTFRGQDIVETILRFAHEYRVGRIVVGRSRYLSPLKKVLGKRSLVENLIERAAGFSVTVVGSGQEEEVAQLHARKPDIEKTTTEKRVATRKSQLSRVLRPSNIVIWAQPVSRDQIIRDLSRSACETTSCLTASMIESALQTREREISTFLNEGVAVPHACMDSLAEIVTAFGVTKQGVTDALSSKPIEAVFMALYPGHLSAEYLRLMSAALSALRDRQVLHGLSVASKPDEVLAVLREWERTRV
jgi:two-component system, OmpR family, sensor histidine kinase KdpD